MTKAQFLAEYRARLIRDFEWAQETARLDTHMAGMAHTILPIGTLVEIPAHYDMWMRGARYGVVRGYYYAKPGAYVNIKLEHPRARRLLKVWASDWSYIKVL